MTQLNLFAEPVTPDPALVCAFGASTAFGVYAPGYAGPHHCPACAASVVEACARFEAAVGRGEYKSCGHAARERCSDRCHPIGVAAC